MIGGRAVGLFLLLVASPVLANSPQSVSQYDTALCVDAQRMIAGDSKKELSIKELKGDGNGFHVIQMNVDEAAGDVVIATTIVHSDVGTGAMPAYVACKMVNRDRINDVLGMQLPATSASCATVNEHTYAVALAGLAQAEREHFLRDGRALSFGEDYVTASGAEWLPAPAEDYIQADEGGLNIVAPAVRVPWNSTERKFFQGTHHCKLITQAAMRRWMLEVSFTDNAELFPAVGQECLAPDSLGSNAGSCRFWFAPAKAEFCQDYSGGGWTIAAARAECGKRHASPEALAAADNRYEGAGGVFAERSCAERDDVPSPAGTCVFHCNASDEILWHTLDANATGPTARAMLDRACDLYIDRP